MPVPINIRKLFQVIIITGFPWALLFFMTEGFVDTQPMLDNPYTSETLLVCGLGYLGIAGVFYNSRPHFFILFFILGVECCLAGLGAWYYWQQWGAIPEELRVWSL
ncbi:hypothetical protein ACDQ55_19185 [Chitinophaga sp. 30R24]|uniref:hypothetical protein n=1 Tax=Chitinophaga sp. 30R24 TaxID=3248838 RepID=UPI003B91B92E